MNVRSINVAAFILSAFGGGVGYVLQDSLNFGLCMETQYRCREIYNIVGEPLLYGMVALALVFLFLIIVPAATRAWGMFALWFVPFAADMFIFYKGPQGGFLDPMPHPEQVFRAFAFVYIVISAAIILTTYIRRKRHGGEVSRTWSTKKKYIFWTLWIVYVAFLIYARVLW